MFKRKAPKQNKDIARTVTLQQAYAKQFDDLFTDIERTTDTADKVLKLQKLAQDINNADNTIRTSRKHIIDKRANKGVLIAGGTGWVAGAAAAAIPIAILAPPLAFLIATGGTIGYLTGTVSTAGRIGRKSQQFVAQHADLKDFQTLLVAKRAQAAEMLDETVKNCDLEKLPLCPNFQDALMSCVPLSERFMKAAAEDAKRAQEEKAALQEQTPVSRKLKISRPHNP